MLLNYNAEFTFIPEISDFLDLFPHRFDYIYAEHVAPDSRPDWFSSSSHALSDRLIRQGAYLYGVRFGAETNYLMIDLDSKSPYHPKTDPFSIYQILQALEPLGLSRYVPVQSSYSGGVHLYFPFVLAQNSAKLGRAAAALLESKGLRLAPGQLEIFPNLKRYSSEPTNFNAHRLPLQAGSYLLNSDWEPVFTIEDFFVERWREGYRHNSISESLIEQAIKAFERKRSWGFLKYDAQKFLNDLNAEIEAGWTGYGQTNRLLGRIAMREFIFGHVLSPGGRQLAGYDLIERIVDVAQSLPGYRRWCRHQKEIDQLAFYWARAIESSPKYYRYGGKSIRAKKPSVEATWNQKQAANARDRIKAAVERLLASDSLPAGVRARMMALKAEGIGTDTLSKNKDLWHPNEFLEPAPSAVFPPAVSENDPARSLEPAPSGLIPPVALISFIGAGDDPPKGVSPPPYPSETGEREGIAADPPLEGINFVKRILDQIRRRPGGSARALPNMPPPDESYFGRLGGSSEPTS